MAASEGIADYYKTVYVDATSTQTYSAVELQKKVVDKMTASETTNAMNPVTYKSGSTPTTPTATTASDITFTITYNEIEKSGKITTSGSIEWNS